MSPHRFRLSLITSALLSSAVSAWAQTPAHEGKALVDAQCNSCHAIGARVGSGYTEEGWKTVMRMMTNLGVPTTAEQLPVMIDYLVKTYPVKGRPEAVLVPGPVKVSLRQRF